MDTVTVRESTYARFPISVEMYHLMGERGVFAPTDRVELIDGELFEMSPIGNLHARCVKFLLDYLATSLRGRFTIGVQDPIVLSDASEPQPDISILKYRADFYETQTPTANDVVIVVEVAESSVDFDREVKFRRYAAAGIREAWLVDLVADRVEVHTNAKENGYGLVDVYHRGESLRSREISSIDLVVDDILGGSPPLA